MSTQHTPNTLYADRDIVAQGAIYVTHVMAMTKEGLHAKSDIAAELAHRDILIADLLEALKAVRMMAVCGQLDQFVGEPWLNAVFAVTAKAEGGGVPAGKLWAIHIPGPNDDHAAPSESMAKAMVAKHNAAMRKYVSKNKLDWGPEMITAKVVEWPWSAEEHAGEVAEFDYAAWGFGNGGVSE